MRDNGLVHTDPAHRLGRATSIFIYFLPYLTREESISVPPEIVISYFFILWFIINGIGAGNLLRTVLLASESGYVENSVWIVRQFLAFQDRRRAWTAEEMAIPNTLRDIGPDDIVP